MVQRTFTELSKIDSYEGRFRYLALSGAVGAATFGSERALNQDFYRSRQWRNLRNHVIARDYGLDLGIPGQEVYDQVIVHHMNPLTRDDVVHGAREILDPEYLITTCLRTHNAIHYGDETLLPRVPITRRPGDTTLW